MARDKDYHYDQDKLLPIRFSRQILPGSFEYTLCWLIDHEFDLEVFAARYRNDETGAPAYDPAILLKIVLYAYSRGMTSSRDIERCCSENIIFMALSADTQPHFTTIAHFISSLSSEIMPLFVEVLLVCDSMGLIGREMFAIDGCKLPSNASKEWSGTKAELRKKRQKMQRAIALMLAKHRDEDARGGASAYRQKEAQQVETLRAQVKKIKDWLKGNDDKPGKTGKPKKRNITDHDSAKMKTSHGVLQGYDALASVDAKHQVVVHAAAFGEAQEHDLLHPMVAATRENCQALGTAADVFQTAALTADSGFHSEQNVKALFAQGVEAYVADTLFRKRDPRFATAEAHRARARAERPGKQRCYSARDFIYDATSQSCVCPAGKALYRNGHHRNLKGYVAIHFQGAQRDGLTCTQREHCLRYPERTPTRQVVFFQGRASNAPESYTEKMKKKIDTVQGRHQYSRRLGIVEPVFGNIRHNLGLDRFRLRSRIKVDIQWKLYCIVHNLLKIHRYGLGSR